ncbi:MAG: DUF2846 domain-containing protein [Saprospiraceae bacterium]|nr:DUF2846 domain-containing protein [Saprospiraceae bacterium]
MLKFRFINQIIQTTIFFSLISFFLGLSSCASLGVLGKTPEYKNYLPVNCPTDKALIYIIREKKYAGSANMINLWVNGNFITQFRNESYYPLIVEPGEKNITGTITNKSLFVIAQIESKGKGEIDLLRREFESGKTYYLELVVTGMNPKMAEVSLIEGEQKIKPLKLFEYNKNK